MKNEITISELARLMQVSVHQIRYFEQKEVLLPAYTDPNQYRMYGLDQVYRLAHILLLRKLGFSVQSIRGSLDSVPPYQITQMLNASLEHIHAEIQKLKELRQLTTKILQEQQEYSDGCQTYRLKWRKAVRLKRWLHLNAESGMNAAMLSRQAPPPNLFESDIHYVMDNSGMVAVCTEIEKEYDLMLPESHYLCFPFLAEHEDEVQSRIEQLFQYASSHSIVTTGSLILIEKSYLSLFSADKLHYELIIAMKGNDNPPHIEESR